jgi:acyl dehydratase
MTQTAGPTVFGRPFGALSVGDEFRTEAVQVRDEDVMTFADLTGDRHPQHVDAEWAGNSAFGERIAHGMLVLSCAFGMLPLAPDYAVAALRRLTDVVFKRPVLLGDWISNHGRIVELRGAGADLGLVTVDFRVLGSGDATVVRGGVELLWRREL